MTWVEYNKLVFRVEKGRVSKQLDSQEASELHAWIDKKISHVELAGSGSPKAIHFILATIIVRANQLDEGIE